MGSKLVQRLTRLLHDKTLVTLCCAVLFEAIKEPPKNAAKIDVVKMQKQQYTHSPNKAKLNFLLFTLST